MLAWGCRQRTAAESASVNQAHRIPTTFRKALPAATGPGYCRAPNLAQRRRRLPTLDTSHLSHGVTESSDGVKEPTVGADGSGGGEGSVREAAAAEGAVFTPGLSEEKVGDLADVRAALLRIVQESPNLLLRDVAARLAEVGIQADDRMIADALIELISEGQLVLTSRRGLALNV